MFFSNCLIKHGFSSACVFWTIISNFTLFPAIFGGWNTLSFYSCLLKVILLSRWSPISLLELRLVVLLTTQLSLYICRFSMYSIWVHSMCQRPHQHFCFFRQVFLSQLILVLAQLVAMGPSYLLSFTEAFGSSRGDTLFIYFSRDFKKRYANKLLIWYLSWGYVLLQCLKSLPQDLS